MKNERYLGNLPRPRAGDGWRRMMPRTMMESQNNGRASDVVIIFAASEE